MQILITFLAGMAVGWWVGRKQPLTAAPENNPPKPPPLLRGIKGDGDTKTIGAYVEKQQSEKTRRKEKILEMFNAQASISNNDVEKMLGVSDASATNYLSELEREGKIEQIGTTGRFVFYRRR